MIFLNNLKAKIVVAVGVGAAVMAGPALAAGDAVDVTATVATITGQLVPVGLIGVAVLGVMVAVKAFRWVRGALS